MLCEWGMERSHACCSPVSPRHARAFSLPLIFFFRRNNRGSVLLPPLYKGRRQLSFSSSLFFLFARTWGFTDHLPPRVK